MLGLDHIVSHDTEGTDCPSPLGYVDGLAMPELVCEPTVVCNGFMTVGG